MAEVIDTFNKFGVGMQAGDIALLNPPPRRITRPDALLLAAYPQTATLR